MALIQTSTRTLGNLTPVDERIIATLKEIRAPAAAAFAQGIKDLEALGPATELREALRATLDALAPDNEVEAMPEPEPNAERRTTNDEAEGEVHIQEPRHE
jgi:hypothetical protein